MSKTRSTLYISTDLWKRFKELTKRNRERMSVIVEGLISNWVKIHEPGNTQRPLTAYDPEHKDHHALKEKEVLELCLEYAKSFNMEIKHFDILTYVDFIKDIHKKLVFIRNIEKELVKKNVKVIY